jgi:hypothetical protein
MDLFDLVPIVPPPLPRRRVPGETPEQSFAIGLAFALAPTIGFLLVLFTGFAFDLVVALVVLPAISGTVALLLARAASIRLTWATVVALGAALLCFMADAGALILHGLFAFFRDF